MKQQKTLYVCSNNKLYRHLIGILSLTDNGFQFEYKLDDSTASDDLILPFFPDKNRIYNDAETRVLLEDYFPSETDTTFMAEILKKLGQSEYNEWEWLLLLENDAESETRLYEQLPDDVIRHDNPVDLSKNQVCESLNQDNGYDMNESPEYDSSEDKEVIDNEDDFDFEFNMPDIDDETDVIDFYENFDGNDFANIDRLLEEDEKKQQQFKAEPTVVESKMPKTNQEHKPCVAVIQTVVHKRKKVIKPGDFIAAPPESPMDLIQQKLVENQKLRQQKLAEQLKINPYKITD